MIGKFQNQDTIISSHYIYTFNIEDDNRKIFHIFDPGDSSSSSSKDDSQSDSSNKSSLIHSEIINMLQKYNTVFEFRMDYFAPLLLSPKAWFRYDLTYSEVYKLFEKVDPHYIWTFNLLFYHPSENFIDQNYKCANHTYQSMFTLLFSTKKSLINSFIDKFKKDLKQENKVPHLYAKMKYHSPYLPIINVEEKTFQKIRECIPERFPSFRWTPIFKCIFRFKDIFVIPMEFNLSNSCILMARIISSEVYEKIWCKPKNCILSLPIHIIFSPEIINFQCTHHQYLSSQTVSSYIQNKKYYYVTDEYFYVQTKHNFLENYYKIETINSIVDDDILKERFEVVDSTEQKSRKRKLQSIKS
jgi:hypothetical protein